MPSYVDKNGENVEAQPKLSKTDVLEQNRQQNEDRKKKLETAKLLWSKAKPVQGSQLGKKYLTKHRKVPENIIDHLEFKFLKKGTKVSNFEQIF